MTAATFEGIDVEIGARLNDILYRRHITKTAAAEVVGVDQSTFSKKLKGKTKISIGELYKLAAFLDLRPADLLPDTPSDTTTFL